MNADGHTSTPSRVIVTGFAWYDSLQYARMVQIADDAASLPPTFEAWLAKAELAEWEARRGGHAAVRIYIDPGDLALWCSRHQRPVDSAAVAAHAAERVQRATAPSILPPRDAQQLTGDELMTIAAVRFLLEEHQSIDPDELSRDPNLSSITALADQYGLQWRPARS